MPDPDLIPHFFTIMKQQGALLAKGWIAGLQFDTLFTDHLYEHIGENAFSCASRQVSFSFWEKVDETHTAIRLATSWATTMEDVERLIALL